MILTAKHYPQAPRHGKDRRRRCSPPIAASRRLVGALTTDSGQFLGILQPYPSSFLGGAHVALGDIDGNGQMELLLSQGVGGRPVVDTFTVSGGAVFRFRIAPIEVP